MDRNDDTLKQGQGIDTGRDEGFQTKGIDKAAIRKMYGCNYNPATDDEARGGVKRPG
jgi:hypothetical protein